MPIIQYQCGQCGETNDYLLSRDSSGPNECANDNCRSSEGPFVRVWHGQTVNVGNGNGGKWGSDMKMQNGAVFEGGLVSQIRVDLPSGGQFGADIYKFKRKNRAD